MGLSVFDLFKIGIGPSSSHTVGPMKAVGRFVDRLAAEDLLARVARVQITLFGSLALTGLGHWTDKAVLLGLAGERPETIDPDAVEPLAARIRAEQALPLGGISPIPFHESQDLIFQGEEFLARHPNALRCQAYAADGKILAQETYYSTGGGFVMSESEAARPAADAPLESPLPYDFSSAKVLLELGKKTNLSIAELVRINERTMRSEEEINAGLDRIWQTMRDCIDRGCAREGLLPGVLRVRRRAKRVYEDLQRTAGTPDPFAALDWVSMFALAVNEENASGGRVVTAPTNGAAGVIPAVLAYYEKFVPSSSIDGIRTFLLTAGAIGMLYKKNASLSAAEMGCQGEIGVACSMAAAGLAAVLAGSNAQIENAAEIGMEHNLGLTCDPIAGLVQVPCIERNTMGAVKAINAARLAVLHGDGTHRVSLDQVIETMRQTGRDMQAKYKETSQGGLAVNFINC